MTATTAAYKPKSIYQTQQEQKLNDVLFPVKFVDLHYRHVAAGQIFEGEFPVPHYRGIVNGQTGKLLSVVTQNYHLISNTEALEMGKRALMKLFPEMPSITEELVPFRVHYNQKKTTCSIDLIHKSVDFNVINQDTWLPFIRVVNSYNRQFKLQFKIGFVRSICTNSVIFEKRVIDFSFPHSRGFIDSDLKVDVDAFLEQKNHFIAMVSNLAKYVANEKFLFDHLRIAFRIKNEDMQNNNMQGLKNKAKEIWDYYSGQDGSSAFALFNTVTDLSSNHNLGQFTGLLRLQNNLVVSSLISEWLATYYNELRRPEFKESAYIDINLKQLS